MTITQHPVQARIPVELFREVISHIDDTSILASVALVCHVLLYEARRQLYTSVAPQDTRNILQHLHLLRTLVDRPHLASLVVSFRSSEVVQVYERPLWNLLHAALRQMPNLKHLHFRSFGGAPCVDLLLDCPFQLEYLHWGNLCERHEELSDVLTQQHQLRYLHLECEPHPLPVDTCPRLEMLEGSLTTFQILLPGRNVTALSWIPEFRESATTQLQLIADSLKQVRMLSFGGYFARPHLRTIIDYMPSLEYLELAGFTEDIKELELVPQLTKLRRLVLTVRRPVCAPAAPLRTSSRVVVMQRLLQECKSLERIDLMHARKSVDEVLYERFDLSSPMSRTFAVSAKKQSLLFELMNPCE